MILFCLPYAGGSESIYYKWDKYIDPSIKLYPIKLKGRGKRFDERFYDSLEEAIDDIFREIQEVIMHNDYAIYGHSMGSLLAYELYYKIVEQKVRKPKHIFFSGYNAPSIIRKRENICILPDDKFIEKIIGLGGTPKELMENKELLEIFIPIIRNDFKIIEGYNYKKRNHKIECDVSILNGDQDSVSAEEVLFWKNHVSRGCDIYSFQGNHFFINSNIEHVSNVINHHLINKSI